MKDKLFSIFVALLFAFAGSVVVLFIATVIIDNIKIKQMEIEIKQLKEKK